MAEVVSLAALIVSGISAFYAYRAPIRAEKLKAASAQRERELHLFTLLMSERGRWGSANMVTALNAAKVVFRDIKEIQDRWFDCYSRVRTSRGHEDVENYFVNPIDMQEAAIKHAQVQQAYAVLSPNTAPSTASPAK